MNKLTVEWVTKAEDDLGVARALVQKRVRFPDQVCFHCQQSIEKYLKALLQEHALAFPRTHDILLLIDLLLPVEPTLRRFRRNARTLTHYAVDYRYPGLRANGRHARSALAKAESLRQAVRDRLHLPR